MEALVIVGFVSNVVQFLEFAGKLVSKTHELYKSVDGVLQEHVHIKDVTEKTRALADTLKLSHAAADPELNQLCSGCCGIAGKLLDALTKVQERGPHTRFESARKALRSVWSKNEISEIQSTLSTFRNQLNLHICSKLRGQISTLSLSQSEAFRQLDECSKTRILQVVDAIKGTKALFAQSLADHTQQIQLSQKETQLIVLEALRISNGEAAVRHNNAQHIQQSSVDGLIQQLHRVCTMQSSSVSLLDKISRNTEDIKVATTTSNASVPTILVPIVEAAVQRSLALSRPAFEDSTSEQCDSRTIYSADGTLPVTGLATNHVLLEPGYPSFTASGPKKERTKEASYPYRFGSVTITQRHTQRIDKLGTNATMPHAKQITIVVSFNTWFLKMALAIDYGTATPSLGGPFLRLQLRAFYIVDTFSPIAQAIEAGNLVNFRQLLVDRKATPFDRWQHGPSLFDFVVLTFSRSQPDVDKAWRASELLKMAEILLESGADCEGSNSFGYMALYRAQEQAEIRNTMARMILSNCKDDPFRDINYYVRIHEDLRALIGGQEHWDTTESKTKFELQYGKGAWQRIMVEGCDTLSWQVEQSVAWEREPSQVRSSKIATEKNYGWVFCTDSRFYCDVSPWLRLRWRELGSSVRHSLQDTEKELELKLSAREFEVLCDEERWNKEPAEVKKSRVKTRKKYGQKFVDQYPLGEGNSRWREWSSWEYLIREEPLLREDRAGSKYNEDSDEEDENSDEDDSSDNDEDLQLVDAKSVGDNSDDSEYETADEG